MTKLINLFDYENAARSRMPEPFFDYYAGGAADEITLRENRLAFERIQLRPRVLVDVSQRTLNATILGGASPLPLMIAPTAIAKLAHPDGEIAIAQAAKNGGIVHCSSTLSNTSLEAIAAVGARSWFQLYVYKDRAITEHLAERAEAAGYQAIVLTVDAPVSGVREGTMRSGLQLPQGLTFENFNEFHNTEAAAILQYVESQFDPSLTWSDLEWLVSLTSLPVLVKGILRGDDANRAVDCGAAAIIVSNHGGRQLDTALTGIEALPEVVAAVRGQAEVYIDGGIRRGTDIIKALAYGARAAMVARPVLWGLAVAGREGVERVLAILQRELDTAMALCGCASLADITPDLLASG